MFTVMAMYCFCSLNKDNNDTAYVLSLVILFCSLLLLLNNKLFKVTFLMLLRLQVAVAIKELFVVIFIRKCWMGAGEKLRKQLRLVT
jgi:hypothetical protein